MPGLIGGVIGGAATALAVSLFWAGGDDSAVTALESRLAAAEVQVGQVSALGERVTSLEATPEAASAEGNGEIAARLGDLEARLAALADMPAASITENGDGVGLGDQLTALQQQVERLAADMQTAGEARQANAEALQANAQALEGLSRTVPTLEETLAATGKTVEDAGAQTIALGQSVDMLSSDVQALATRVGDTEGRLDHLGGEYQRGAAMIVAIGDINRAIARAEPYDTPLQSLTSLVRDDAVLTETLSALEPMAAAGVPTLSDLKRDYVEMASRVLLAESGNQSLTDKVGNNMFGIFNMRPAGAEAEGSDSRAILSRAQARLSNGDLEGAVAELAGLEGAAAEEASAWTDRARGRLSAEAAIVDLRSHAQGLVAKGS